MSNHACVKCAAGFGRDGGDALSGPDTACSETYTLFVSSTSHNGDMGGLAGADAICQNLANNSPLAGGTYVALLSTSTVNAIDRIANDSYAIRRPDGIRLAANRAALFGGPLLASTNVTESGGQHGRDDPVYSGSEANGTVFGGEACNDWMSADPANYGVHGAVFEALDGKWFNSSADLRCDNGAPIYCIGR